jgi:hypothetical protein
MYLDPAQDPDKRRAEYAYSDDEDDVVGIR